MALVDRDHRSLCPWQRRDLLDSRGRMGSRLGEERAGPSIHSVQVSQHRAKGHFASLEPEDRTPCRARLWRRSWEETSQADPTRSERQAASTSSGDLCPTAQADRATRPKRRVLSTAADRYRDHRPRPLALGDRNRAHRRRDWIRLEREAWVDLSVLGGRSLRLGPVSERGRGAQQTAEGSLLVWADRRRRLPRCRSQMRKE